MTTPVPTPNPCLEKNSTLVPNPSTPLSGVEQLLRRFEDVPDFRVTNDNSRHLLLDIIASTICAILGGANSWDGVVRFVQAHETWFRTFLKFPHGMASHDTYRRIFLLLSTTTLETRFLEWMRDISGTLEVQQIALDGKTLCGSGVHFSGLKPLHLVSAFATENGVCLGQVATEKDSNEIPAIPQLLSLLTLKGTLVTIDAMGCQKAIAEAVVDGGGDYVLAVKGNQERLHEDVQTVLPIPSDKLASHRETDTYARTDELNGGRLETRQCQTSTNVLALRDQKEWKGIQTIARIDTRREYHGKIETETRYYISSRKLSASEVLQSVRSHWLIENQYHWVLDVVFGEDDHQLRAGNGPQNFATLRRLAQGLIKNYDNK